MNKSEVANLTIISLPAENEDKATSYTWSEVFNWFKRCCLRARTAPLVAERLEKWEIGITCDVLSKTRLRS